VIFYLSISEIWQTKKKNLVYCLIAFLWKNDDFILLGVVNIDGKVLRERKKNK
jgi:hypothetical protein